MCFSATASFVTSGATALAGGASIRRAKPSQYLIASAPLIFSAQQFIEGLIWVTHRSGTASPVLGYLFLFFAFLWWPVYIPLALHSVEQNKLRKNALKGFILFGIITSAYLLAVLYVQPLSVEILSHSVHYNIEIPLLRSGAVMYIAVVVGSLFVASGRYAAIFGALVLVSALVSLHFYAQTFISVWCFFAAALSALIYIYIKRTN